jgi:hypothetical protein
MRLEGLGKLKNSMTSSGIEPACSIVPQPTTLPHAPSYLIGQLKRTSKKCCDTDIQGNRKGTELRERNRK